MGIATRHIYLLFMPSFSFWKLIKEIIETVPEIEGLYQLLDEFKTIIAFDGTANLQELLKKLGSGQRMDNLILRNSMYK